MEMERQEIEKCLYNALNPNDAIRREAEMRITDFQSKDYCSFVQNVVSIFKDINSSMELKMLSGIILKNSLHSSDAKIQDLYEQKWSAIDNNTREYIKKQIIECFGNTNEKIANLAGSALGYIARIELSLNLYFDFFDVMVQVMQDDLKASAVYEAVSTCCATLTNETLFNFKMFLNTIFNICMMKLENPQTSANIKEVALKCTMNCFKTLQDVFNNENAVIRFLNSIAMSTTTDASLTPKALICLNKFVFLNYNLIENKIPDIITFFNNFWTLPSEEVLVQVIEFWTILAEIKEINFIEEYLEFLLPHVLRLMKKNEDYVDLKWNAHKASAYLLETISETYGSKILFNNLVFNYIESELNSGDKIRIDTGAIVLGSVIVKECDQQLVNFIKILISYMKDPITEESCLWCLAKICETNFYAVVEHLAFLLNQTCEIIISKSPSSTTAAWILNSIFISLNFVKQKKIYSTKFSLETQQALKECAFKQIREHFTEILKVLIAANENVSLENSTLRVALFAAMAEQIRFTEQEYYELLDNVIVYCQNKIVECVEALNKASASHIPIIEDILSNYIILSEVVIGKRSKDSASFLLPVYISVLKSKPSSAIGEVYIAVTSNIHDFSNFLEEFVPFIARDLGCLDSFILKSAINLIGFMANSIQKNFFHLSTQLIPLLIQNLSSKLISKQVKTQILSVFGDIAISLENNFEQYIDMSMMIFMQIINLEKASDPNYVDDLRDNVIQMFNCILFATCKSNKLREVIYKLVEGIKKLLADENSEETLTSIATLITDLKAVYGLHYDLNGKWVEDFYNQYITSKNPALRNAVQKIYN